jgi:PhzF family phenazine biosynthesis protein
VATHRFMQVDVFTSRALLGNPVAIVFDADDLSVERMQAIARWTNLSETTFVQSSQSAQANYRLRIFTPGGEIPFAGHPTLGSALAFATLHGFGQSAFRVAQECGVGLVAIHANEDRRVFLELPARTLHEVSAAHSQALQQALGTVLTGPARIVDLGPRWLTAPVENIAALRKLDPDMMALTDLSRELEITGANIFAREGMRVEVRSFAPRFGVAEDPVCGSGNGAVAAYLAFDGHTEDYVANQGWNVARDGNVSIMYGPNGQIHLGGNCVICVDGSLTI